MDSDSSRRDNQDSKLHGEISKPHRMELQYLKEITNNFSQERILGQGGFGVVYKGVPEKGDIIAVKKLRQHKSNFLKQFENELGLLVRLKHPNIVRLIGYCYESQREHMDYNGESVFAEWIQTLLCLEYLPMGSLDHYISDESRRLDWRTSYTIIEGICHGLQYLHEQAIIHLDLKPANILLTDDMVPKVTDFGLSRLLGEEQTMSTLSIEGTLGYMPREYMLGGTMTKKSDIFSLGVIILELVTGHRDYPGVTGTSSEHYVEDTLKKWSDVLTKSPGSSLESDCQQIKKCIQVGLICVNPERTKRPTAAEVIEMLQGSESMDCHSGNEVTSSASQSRSGPRELLDIYPLELCFSLVTDKPCLVKLTNRTDGYVAFHFKATRARSKYHIEPSSGFLWPRCPLNVVVTMEELCELPPDLQYHDEFLVQSIIVSTERLVSEHITEDTFNKVSSKMVQKVNLVVVYKPAAQPPPLLHAGSEETKTTNMQRSEVFSGNLVKGSRGQAVLPLESHMNGGNVSSSNGPHASNEIQIIGDRTSENGCIMPLNVLHGSSELLSNNQSPSGRNFNQEEYISGANGTSSHSPRLSLDNGCVAPLGTTVHRDEMVDETCRVENDNGVHHTSDEEHPGFGLHDHNENPMEYFPTSDNAQSILVSLSVACPLQGIVCKHPHLFHIEFYGYFDKPLGRYFREDLFSQISRCESCKEPAESHVQCYTHQQGSLTISVENHPSVKLPGWNDGEIWMWHRCLRCKPKDGIRPPTQKIVMSDAEWGLSFGKFLELSFSNHTTANQVACCGHSLQRDCVRFYGSGSMVAVFRYSPIDFLSVNLPPSVLDFAYPMVHQDWLIEEAGDVANRKDNLYRVISDKLDCIEKTVSAQEDVSMKAHLHRHVVDLKDLIKVEWKKYDVSVKETKDVLELNYLRRELVLDAYVWSRRLHMMHSLTKENSHNAATDPPCPKKLPGSTLEDSKAEISSKQENAQNSLEYTQSSSSITDAGKPLLRREQGDTTVSHSGLETNIDEVYHQSVEGSTGSSGLHFISGPCEIQSDGVVADELKLEKILEKSEFSASNLSDRMDLAWTGSSVINFRKRSPVDDPNVSIRRAYSQRPPRALERTGGRGLSPTSSTNMLSLSGMIDGEGRMLLSQSVSDVVVPVYDNEPSSMIAHAMTVPEYHSFMLQLLNLHNELDRFRSCSDVSMRSHGSDQPQPRTRNDSKDNHLTVSFEDEDSCSVDKANFSVTCYFAKQFDEIRRKCCADELDYIRSLSRCKRWSPQGGKGNAYFAKTLDDRFVLKQVTRTELDSFEDYAVEYFKYFTESVYSGSPFCLAKVLGLYQVIGKNMKNGKKLKMELMVMENIFFKRNVSRIYDLKGSVNPVTSGNNKVRLDVNLLETLHTKPIFLRSEAKRRLERAVWNDTSFLASVGVMDYSLLVGIDKDSKELVIGIIDYLQQYMWDRQLKTWWVKASGILGGSKGVLPTVVSPYQYKKRFRKAMSKYFLTVPDQWSP